MALMDFFITDAVASPGMSAISKLADTITAALAGQRD